MARGRFITFEGGEGSGKSTQALLLADRLRRAGIEPVVTREPGGSPFAERVRALILDPGLPPHGAVAEALLFYAARADHLAATIRPALEAGRWVIADRFSDSTRVYQVHAGGLPAATFAALEDLVVADLTPDLTLILDLPAGDGLARAETRRSTSAPAAAATAVADRFERRDLAYHERLREGFKGLAVAEPRRCVLIDATRDRSAVAEDAWAAVADRLGPV